MAREDSHSVGRRDWGESRPCAEVCLARSVALHPQPTNGTVLCQSGESSNKSGRSSESSTGVAWLGQLWGGFAAEWQTDRAKVAKKTPGFGWVVPKSCQGPPPATHDGPLNLPRPWAFGACRATPFFFFPSTCTRYFGPHCTHVLHHLSQHMASRGPATRNLQYNSQPTPSFWPVFHFLNLPYPREHIPGEKAGPRDEKKNKARERARRETRPLLTFPLQLVDGWKGHKLKHYRYLVPPPHEQ